MDNSSMFIRIANRVAASAFIALASCVAWAEPQAVKVQTADFMVPGDADSWFYNQDTSQAHANGLGNTQRPIEIKELARALGAARYTGDAYAANVFQYVYNNIATEFRFGLSKGAVGALIDQSGTPFDQANLMVELLREQSGVTATYVVGTVTLDGTEFSDWTGLTNATAACRLLADGGIPGEINSQSHSASCSYTGNVSSVTMSQVWVSVTTGTGTKVYDPSYKKHTLVAGMPLATALACGTTGCGALAQAAAHSGSFSSGTSPAPWVQNLNTAALGAQLRTSAYNMRTYIETNNRIARIEDVVGGRLIDATAMPSSFTSLPYDPSPSTLRTWTGDIPNAYRTKITLQFDQISKLFYADELYGSSLGLQVYMQYPSGAPSYRASTLWLGTMIDGAAASLNLGTSAQTGNTTSNDILTLVIDHPYYASAGGGAAAGSYMDDVLVHDTLCQISSTGTFDLTLILGLGETGPGLMAHQAWLRSYNVGPPGASFDGLSGNWLAQRTRATALVGQIDQVRVHHHHSLGYVNTQSGSQASYVVNVESALSVVQATNDANLRQAAIFATTTLMSGLEGGVSEQSFGSWDGGSAVTLFGLANEKGFRFYDATQTNVGSIFGVSSPGYTGAQQTAITSYLTSSAWHGIIPSGGEIGTFTYSNAAGSSSATWNVMPFVTYTSGGERVAYINGELAKGAGSSAPDSPAGVLDESLRNIGPAKPRDIDFSVDSSTGDVTVRPAPDLVTGTGEFPKSLSLQRTYRSSNPGFFQKFSADCPGLGAPCLAVNNREGVLPVGWNHNFDIYGQFSGDGLQGLGADSGLDASSAIAAIYAITDLFTGTSPAFESRVTAIFAANWLMQQLASNAVVVHRGERTDTFIRLPDASSGTFSFNPPPGSSDTLIRTGSEVVNRWAFGGLPFDYSNDMQFQVRDKDGSLLELHLGDIYKVVFSGTSSATFFKNMFRPTAWTFPDGTRLSFTYQVAHLGEWPTSPSQGSNQYKQMLTKVANNLGRELNFIYADITKPYDNYGTYLTVTDENSRTVQFQNNSTYFSVIGADSLETREDYTVPPVYGPYYTPSLRNRLAKITLPGDSTPYVTFNYDALQRVTSSQDGLGNVTSYYSAGSNGERLRRGDVVDPLGAVTTTFFNENGQPIQQYDPLARVTSNVYDSAGRLKKTTYPEGNTLEHDYDARNNVVVERRKSKPGSGLGDLVTSYTYYTAASVASCSSGDAARCNRVVSIDGPRTDVTDVSTYAYNADGTLARITGPTVPLGGSSGSPQTDFCYAPFATSNGSVSLLTGKIVKANASSNRVTTYAYNPSNKYVLQSITLDPSATLTPPATPGSVCGSASKSGLNLTSTPTFDAVGNIATVDGPRTTVSDVTSYTFDSMRRLTRVGAPLGSITRYEYDLKGRLTKTRRSRVALPSTPNESVINEAEWQTQTQDYNLRGDLVSVIDAEGNQAVSDYDKLRRLRVATDPDGRQTATVYDLAGQKLCIWKGGSGWTAGSAPSTCTWSGSSYQITAAFRYEASTYSLNSKQQTVEDSDNNVTEYRYDGFDRLAFSLFPDPSAGTRCSVATPITSASTPTCSGEQTYEKSTYDEAGDRLTYLTRKSDTVTWTYDALSRISTRAVSGTPALAVVSYGYNLKNEAMSISSPVNGSIPAHSVAYDYDDAGRKLYEESLINGATRRVSYQVDEAGNRLQTTWPDSYYIFYTYDDLNRLQYVRENSTSANELAFYDYDVLSRRKTLRYAGQSTNEITYTYEPDSDLDLLTNVLNTVNVTLDYGHNKSHQTNRIDANDDFYLPAPSSLTTTAYVPDKLNRYASVASNTAGYDRNGNLLTWGPTAALNTYTYDPENRLRTAVITGGSSASYDYDPLGRRLQKTVDGTATYYLLDGDEEIAEYSAGGTVLRRYIMGPAVDDRVAAAEGSATISPPKTYYHVNHQRSVIAMADDSGNLTGCGVGVNCQRLSYDEYGNLGSGSAGTGQPYRYTGRRFDLETGLYHYRARYYSPQIGRFLQTDPIGYDDDLNLYAYTGNNPVDATDPTGMDIFLQSHPVALGANHSKVTVIPKNQSRYQNDPRFSHRLADGRVYATLGAGPSRGVILWDPGKLVAGANRERDLNLDHNVSSELLNLPIDDEDTVIENLFSALNAYDNSITYTLFPDKVDPDFEINSNGFASGLLKAVGFSGFHKPNHTPGFGRPVPWGYFRHPTITIEVCKDDRPDHC